MGNNENVVVTNNPRIVTPFVGEFDKLWLQNPETATGDGSISLWMQKGKGRGILMCE